MANDNQFIQEDVLFQPTQKEKAPAKHKDSSFEYAPTQTRVLQRAIVEDIKVMEDVL